VNLYTNRKAHFILERDLQRTCEYFAQQGVRCDAGSIMDGLWHRYVQEVDPEDLAADWSRLAEDMADLPGAVSVEALSAR
jgi:serine/threonine-protein kinase RIO1